jgi:hypothetical protein
MSHMSGPLWGLEPADWLLLIAGIAAVGLLALLI